ncbi:MAG: hypothetical protein ACHBN1_07830 [Heteroscytonema crispum UTEX LB 1556]
MNRNGFAKLTNFLTQLEQNKIHYTLAHHRDEAIMIMVAIPGERWEIEFFHNGLVEIERFKSCGEIEGETVLSQLFAAYSESVDVNNIPASSLS